MYHDIANEDGHTPTKCGPVRNDNGMRAASVALVDNRPGTFIGYNQSKGWCPHEIHHGIEP